MNLAHRSPSRPRLAPTPGHPNMFSPFPRKDDAGTPLAGPGPGHGPPGGAPNPGSGPPGSATPQVGGPMPMPPMFGHGPAGHGHSFPPRTQSSHQSSFFFGQQPVMGQGAPVPADRYAADCSDPIDMMLVSCLGSLDRITASKLLVRKLGMGRYEIDNSKVAVRWGDCGGIHGLLVREEDVKDSTASEMPLPAYLAQAANVAASLSGLRHDMSKIARIPKEQRLTFAEPGSETKALKLDTVGNERCESMRIAVEQAMLREQAAEAYERGMYNNQYGSAPPRGLPPPRGLGRPT